MQYFTHRSPEARGAGPAQRRLAWIARQRARLAGRPPGGPEAAALAEAIALITGEPVAHAHRFLAASAGGNRAFQEDYDALAGADGPHLARLLGRVSLPHAHELSTALAGLGRPLLLACSHSGRYLSGLLRLLPELPDLRGLTLLKRPAADDREARLHAHLARMGIDLQVLRLAERPLLPALDALRRGRHVLLMLDVPPGFLTTDASTTGRGVAGLREARLFGHAAWLPEGPAALAVAAGALVLPVTCGRTPDGADEVRLAPLIDAARDVGEPRAAAVARVHLTLARQLEAWLRRWPEDWMLWPHLPGCFVPPPPGRVQGHGAAAGTATSPHISRAAPRQNRSPAT